MDWIDGGVAQGFVCAGVRAGIKTDGPDVAVLASEAPCSAAGVFTRNAFISPAALHSRRCIAEGRRARGVFMNSGCANACTGPAGEADLLAIVEATGTALDEALPDVDGVVLAAQTGIIGERLPLSRVEGAIRKATQALCPEGWASAAEAIMTTDTVPKTCALEIQLGGQSIRIGGMAKGSGMIAPNMGTMHAFLTTDIAATAEKLQPMLVAAADDSFNAITIDGDGSTSDTVLLLANGASGVMLCPQNEAIFCEALGRICQRLARAIVADGEGATKTVEIGVTGARSRADARMAARAVAESLLTKTAVFGADPNWGRILAAVGRSGAEVRPETTALAIGGVTLFRGGVPCEYDVAEAQSAMAGDEISIDIDLGIGDGRARMWTCDLSYDYVRINAEYHT